MIGKNRKNELRALFADSTTTAKSGESNQAETKQDHSDNRTPPESGAGQEAQTLGNARTASGAVKAMGLTLSSITREAEEARVLRQALQEGERVISLDPALIESSFISDRLSDQEKDDPEFLALVDSIRESGQQVPILVRRHPDHPERFQVAYGHRRLNAVRRLGLPVKALVRALSDSELVLAQGKENAERRNLSFIERALFAKALGERGFDRKVIGDALSVQKSELSRLMQVADAVPEHFIRAIGPAPKAGRDRWMALAQLLGQDKDRLRADQLIVEADYRLAGSDERFQMLFEALKQKPETERDAFDTLTAPDGTVFARLQRHGRKIKLEFLSNVDPGFVEAFEHRLATDYASYLNNRSQM
ncbi:plasmid partitioning protein RepB [Allorhizobium sp. BGMRC 0089]|uniref:plasmid partitioning protein RepB n=1 Tax=Allorhizobium sonneratiae TaxID=2934936 RepID=UPI00203487FC|nr:plasmid partitioning protein RepB [Allorhizobium sonneratiae]MCM2293181.1 plasmid partitioning protein RepB [Allorhizobium sonneratiae]